ncbi:alpha/beta hydrolase [Desulfovibrio sp. Huiquan2017]|uniref:alpha/beta fold hydrolase n=1 Tax=Desulfovibrio sp. Huiquan2017 TaxID=2816861 RepID=UPI001A9349A5|nr:alpha/beta hydrolase [Desulfovibrio sp. Huiquan2017]
MRPLLRLLCAALLSLLCACAIHRGPQDTPVRIVEADGVSLAYRTLGSGPPLLLIMGYAGTMDVWDGPLVAELARSRTVILFDNRGMGYSGTDGTPLTIDLMASDALALLDALGLARADVMGWSMGSIIAQEMALTHPERVGKLILYGTAVDPAPVMAALDDMGTLAPEDFLARLFPEPWRTAHPDIYSRLPAPAIAPSPDVIRQQYRALDAWPGTRDRLAALDRQTLIIVGEADRVTPPDQALDAAALIPGAWLARYKGAGHWLMYQAGQDMARTIEDFLTVHQDLLR